MGQIMALWFRLFDLLSVPCHLVIDLWMIQAQPPANKFGTLGFAHFDTCCLVYHQRGWLQKTCSRKLWWTHTTVGCGLLLLWYLIDDTYIYIYTLEVQDHFLAVLELKTVLSVVALDLGINQPGRKGLDDTWGICGPANPCVGPRSS